MEKFDGKREDNNYKQDNDSNRNSTMYYSYSYFNYKLYADCKKGNRPSFINAGKPDFAKEMYEYIIEKCKEEIPVVAQGIFGADMKISLLNDGPFTIILDSNEIC